MAAPFKSSAEFIKDTQVICRKAIDFCDYISNSIDNIKLDYTTLLDVLTSKDSIKEHYGRNLVRDDFNELLGVIHETTGIALTHLGDMVFGRTEPESLWGKEVGYLKPKRKRVWVIARGQKRIAIAGSTQSGKTAVQTAWYFLYTLLTYVLSDGQYKVCPVYNVPPNHSLRTQTLSALRAFRHVFSEVRIVNKTTNFSCSINEYWEMMYHDGLLHDENESVIIRSLKGKNQGRKSWLKAIKCAGYIPVSFIDEPHFGSNEGGVQDLLHQSITIDGIELPISQFSIGATNPEQAAVNSEEWKFCPIPLGPNFCGSSFYDGNLLPFLVGYVPIKPKVFEIESYIRKLGFYVDGLSLSRWKFDKKMSLDEQRIYVTCIMKVIADFSFKNPLARSACVRASISNACLKQFIALAIELFPDLHDRFVFKEFCGKNVRENELTVKHLCQEAEMMGKFAIILVTAGARMGDAFPTSTKLFIDLTVGKTTTIDAVIQGLAGRATGYGKSDVTVLVNEKPYFILKNLEKTNHSYVETARLTGCKPGLRTTVAYDNETSRRKRNTKTKIFRIYRQDHPQLEKHFKVIESVWQNNGKVTRGAIFKADELSVRHICILNGTIKAAFSSELLSSLPYSLYTWGEIVDGENLPFDVVTDYNELINNLRSDRTFGAVGFRWLMLGLEDFLDEQGSKFRRIGSRRNPEPQMGVTLRDKKCPECQRNTKEVIIELWKTLDTRSRSGGYWEKMIKDRFKDSGGLCCLSHYEIEILFIDFYCREMSLAEQEFLTRKTKQLKLYSHNSRFINNSDFEINNSDLVKKVNTDITNNSRVINFYS